VDDVHQVVVLSEHERVDENALAFAAVGFVEGSWDDQRVQVEGVFVDLPVVVR
jgi:hypothetical protein